MYSVRSCFHEASVIQKSERGLREVGTRFQGQAQTMRNTLQKIDAPSQTQGQNVSLGPETVLPECPWEGKCQVFTLRPGNSMGDKIHLLSTGLLPLKGDFHQLLNQIQKLQRVSVMTLKKKNLS